jgi:hypothetical protein
LTGAVIGATKGAGLTRKPSCASAGGAVMPIKETATIDKHRPVIVLGTCRVNLNVLEVITTVSAN